MSNNAEQPTPVTLPVLNLNEQMPVAHGLSAFGGKKTTPADWRDLQSRFQSLRRDYGDHMAANWIATSWNEDGDQWYLSGANQDRERELFVVLVELAVAKLDPRATNALSFWLDLLRQQSPSLRFPFALSHGNADGTWTSAQAVILHRVIQASADYCLRLETNGIRQAQSRRTNESRSQSRKPGKRPDPHYRNAVRKAISQHGSEWRDHLCDIFRELDKQGLPLKGFQDLKIDLGDGKQSRVSSWSELDLLEGEQRRKVIDALRKYLYPRIESLAVD
jgi:hypothetical protein